MNVQKLHHHSPRLRKRSKLATHKELVQSCGFVLLLFGILVFKNGAAINEVKEINDAINHPAITIVTCEVSTPHSQHPETAAHGRFEIAMFTEDIRKPGSSAADFVELVEKYKFYDMVYTLRAVKGYVVQFGHHAKKEENKAPPAKARNEDADKVPKKADNKKRLRHDSSSDEEELSSRQRKHTRSERLEQLRQKRNSYGTVTMIAGAAGQVFVNIGDNYYLDESGTVPFGVVLEDERDQDLDEEEPNKHSGMGLVDSIYHDYKPGTGQVAAVNQNTVEKDFPEMGRIDRCYVSAIQDRYIVHSF